MSAALPLKNKKVLITAGPTREYWDPVRFLTNASSGEMGFRLADEFKKRGARVTMVAGPSQPSVSKSVRIYSVQTARQMHKRVMKEITASDVFVATAAVSDYRFASPKKTKIKKNQPRLTLTLHRNPDILAEVGRWKKTKKKRLTLIGFALENANVAKESLKKLHKKNLDLIIGNRPTSFSNSKIVPFWLERQAPGRRLNGMSKKRLAQKIVRWTEDHGRQSQ